MNLHRALRAVLAATLLLLLASCGAPSRTSVPAAPSNVRTEPIAGGVRVRWDAGAPDITGFDIERASVEAGSNRASALATGSFTKIGSAPKGATHYDDRSFDDSSTTAGRTYRYRVIAEGADGASSPAEQTNPPVAPLPGVALSLELKGSGTVSVDDGIEVHSCEASCTLTYPDDSDLNLSATGRDDHAFAGWTGACTGAGPCALKLDGPATVGATFATKVLSVTLQGDVGVTITISPGADGSGSEECVLRPGDTCAIAYQDQVDLTASIQLQKSTAEPGSVFRPLQGCASNTSERFVYCLVNVPDGHTQVTATVVRPPQALDDAYEVLEDGALDVAAPGVLANDEDSLGDLLRAFLDTPTSKGNLDLDESGSFRYRPGTDFTGSDAFTYHARDAYGNTSELAMATITVIPVNDAPVFRIAADPPVVKVGAGAQEIPDFATDIDPGGGPDEEDQILRFETALSEGSSLAFTTPPRLALDGTLTYTPAFGSFGKATVTVTLIDDGGTENGGVDRSSRSFTIKVDPMFLRYETTGGGSLSVAPLPTNGGYARDTVVTLTATAGPGERLVGWGGACGATDPAKSTCTLTMTEDLNASAIFEQVHTLTVIISSRFRFASVTSDPAGIDVCTNRCSAAFKAGTEVTLTAKSSNAYLATFDGWDDAGACSSTVDDGEDTCTVTMDADKTVTAQFKVPWD